MDKLELIKINDWVFDPLKKSLTKEVEDGEPILETLEAKHSELLHCLINHQDQVVTRDQLIELVWKNRFVDDRTINATVSRLRKVLGGDKDEFIKTHPKVGYSFMADIVYIDRPTPEKIKQEQNAKINLSLYKGYALLSIGIFLVLIWQLLVNIKEPITILTKDEVVIEPLTYEEGWEIEPSLSYDGNFLAYTSTENDDNFFSIKVKSIKTNETVKLDSKGFVRSSQWSPTKNELYYAAAEGDDCVIEKVTMIEPLVFSAPTAVTSCGDMFEYPSIAISSDEKWLYYTFKDENKSSIVKRLNLNSGFTEPLTIPLQYAGDFNVALSKDDKKLAFIRFFDNSQSTAFVLELESLQLTEVTNTKQEPYHVTWTTSIDHLLIADSSSNTISSINVETLENTPIFQYDEHIGSPLVTDSGEILLPLGDKFKSNIVKASLANENEEFTLSPFISSTFKDHDIQNYQDGFNDVSYFVSNRSGGYQVWQKSNNLYKQLTNFTDKYIEIIELELSPDKSRLLFQLNEKLHVLQIDTGQVTQVSHPTSLIGNGTWKCENNNELLVTAKEKGEWGLYLVDIETGKSELKQADIVNIKNICSKSQYAVVKQNLLGVFLQDKELQNITDGHLMTSINCSENLDWDINEHYFVLYDGININIIDIESRVRKIHNVEEYILDKPRINGKTVFFNDLEVNNTYIGQMAIPNIPETI